MTNIINDNYKLLVDGNAKKSVNDRTEIKLGSIVYEKTRPYLKCTVYGIYPPGTPRGGKRGKILCISQNHTVEEFFPHIIGASFYKKTKEKLWQKYDSYGRLIEDKRKTN